MHFNLQVPIITLLLQNFPTIRIGNVKELKNVRFKVIKFIIL